MSVSRGCAIARDSGAIAVDERSHSAIADRTWMKLHVYEDNQSTMVVARKGYSKQLKHLKRTHRVNLSWVAEVVNSCDVVLHYMPSELQAANILTQKLLVRREIQRGEGFGRDSGPDRSSLLISF